VKYVQNHQKIGWWNVGFILADNIVNIHNFNNSNMAYVSVHYTVKYRLSFSPKYLWLENNMCYNAKTGRLIKQVLKNGCIGYIIDGKFLSLSYLRKHLIK
jgi:hypothetical protein